MRQGAKGFWACPSWGSGASWTVEKCPGWLWGGGTSVSFEGLCKDKKAGQLLSPPQLPRQVGRTVPHGRTLMGDALACQDPDRGRWEVFSGREMWGWLISATLMLHTAAGEKNAWLVLICCQSTIHPCLGSLVTFMLLLLVESWLKGSGVLSVSAFPRVISV